MTENPLTKNPLNENPMNEDPLNEDLLTKIQREMDERLRGLRGAVDEHDRLAAELRALDTAPQPAAYVRDTAPQPAAQVRRGSVGCESPRTAAVSPKVTRLMHSPRRPSLERPGVARVSAYEHSFPAEDDLLSGVRTTEVDIFPGIDPVPEIDPAPEIDELDVEAMRYERSL
jgi:hypothetical protein